MISIKKNPASAFLAACATIALSGGILGGLSGCLGSHDHGGEAGYKEDACEHMADGPSAEVTAGESRDDSLPDVSAPHTRHDITLPNSGGAYEGFVAFQADEENDFHFALGGGASLQVLDSSGAAVAREGAVDSVGGCAEVNAYHTYELDAGRYFLHFTSGFETGISLVALEGDAHAH